MHIVLGASGHIGTALVEALVARDERVIAICHGVAGERRWQDRGVETARVEADDVSRLRAVIDRPARLFLLNPPAAPSGDTDVAERVTSRAILSALAGSRIVKVVAESTYAAQPGAHLGDLGVLEEMEQALAAQTIPVTVIRGAYYMSNWEASLATAKKDGVVRTFFPVDHRLPMVSPRDLGVAAARYLMEPVASTGRHHVEGPERYTPADVADAFGAALGKNVRAVTIPRNEWRTALAGMGFSAPAAESFCAMTDAAIATTPPDTSTVVRGPTSLGDFIASLVRAGAPS